MVIVKKYTHLFFDLDNTLWDFKRNSRGAMQVAFEKCGLKTKGHDFNSFFEQYSKYNKQLWTAYRKNEIRKKELTSQRFLLTFNHLQIRGVDALKMNDCYLKEMPKQNILLDGTFELLDYLKQKNYRLFIITNGFKEVQYKKLETSGLLPYFEKVFISEEIKCPKPGRQIFEHAIKSGNAPKNRSLMIGDDFDVDVMGALNFGIDAVYFCGQPSIKEFQNSVQGYSNVLVSISELHELKQVL